MVRGFSADLPAGRLVRVAGRNGSGKSTLLRVVAGVSRPSAGKVTGRPHCGYVPERFPGGLPFSGREYLLHLARIHGLRGGVGLRRSRNGSSRLGAAGYADQPLRSMSKGMCQKMAIAQALLPSPGLLVLDEAWTGLDQAARGELDAAVDERVAAGGTVLFVDHDQARLAGREDERWDFDGTGRVDRPGRARPPWRLPRRGAGHYPPGDDGRGAVSSTGCGPSSGVRVSSVDVQVADAEVANAEATDVDGTGGS